MTDAAVQALAAVAGQLGWQQYCALLHAWLRYMKQRTTKATVRALCAVLDSFHFPLPGELGGEDERVEGEGVGGGGAGSGKKSGTGRGSSGSGDGGVVGEEGVGSREKQEGKGEEGEKQEEGDVGGTAAEGEEEGEEEEEEVLVMVEDEEAAAATAAAAVVAAEDAAATAAEVQRVLLLRVLPALHEHLVVEEGGEARAPVAIALVKLMKVWMGSQVGGGLWGERKGWGGRGWGERDRGEMEWRKANGRG